MWALMHHVIRKLSSTWSLKSPVFASKMPVCARHILLPKVCKHLQLKVLNETCTRHENTEYHDSFSQFL